MSMSNFKSGQVNRKSRFTRARIAGLSASAVASLYGSFANRALAATTNNPILGLTGWNQDLVAENPLSTSTTAGFDTANGEDFFVNGLIDKGINTSSNVTAYGTGLPLNNMLVSAAAGTSTTFQFQPYTTNNALLLTPLIASSNSSGIAPSTATLNLAAPTATSGLAFLMASTNGGQTINYTLNYVDGTTATGSFSAPDWFNNSPYAAGGLGRTTARLINSTQAIGIDTGSGTAPSTNPRLYEYDVPASVFNGSTGKYLSSISFTSPTTNSNATGIFAVSGVLGATLAPTPLTYSGLNSTSWGTTGGTNFNSASGPVGFANGQGPVTFDDTANASQVDANGNITINIQAAGVSPAGVIFNNSYGNPGSIGYVLTDGPVFGPGGLTITNSGSVYVQNANTYIGATNVSNGGYLEIDGAGSISSQTIIVGAGAELAVLPGGLLAGNSGLTDNGLVLLAATPQTIGYLSGSGQLNLSGGVTTTIGGQLGYSTSFSGLITGNGNLLFRAPVSILGANNFVGTNTLGLNAAVLLGNPLSLGNASNTIIVSGSTSLEKMGGIGAAVPLTASTGGAVPYNVSFSGTNYFGFSGTNPLELSGNFTNWNTSGVTFNMISLPTAPLILDGKIGVGGGGLTVIGGATTDGGGTFLGGLLILNNSSGTNALTGTVTIGGTGNGGALELIGANETGAVTTINVSASGANAALPATLIVSDNTGAAGYVGGNMSGARITTNIYGLGASLAVPNSATGVITPASFGALRGADNQNTIWAGNVSVGATAGISGGINGTLTLTGIISGSSQIQFSGNNNSNTVLANVETYTGETAISGYQGKLTLGAPNAISKSSDLNLDTSANGSQGTTFDLAGYSTVIGYLTTTSALPATAGDIITNSGSTLATLTLNGSGGTFSGSIQETTAGPISIYLNTTGTQTFNAASNYSGGTTMNGSGSLLAGNSGAFGSGALTLNSGYLGSSNAAGVTITTPINYNAATGIQLNVLNPINIPQAINIPAGTILPFKTTGTDPTGKNGTFSGVISGGGTVNIIGTVAFTGSNTYTGGTNLTSGSLAIPSDTGHLGTGPVNFLGGALTFENYTSYLSFSNASGSTIPVTLGAAAGAPSTLAGNISGGAGFNFVGPGILILAGSNSYTGPTTISGGELSYQSGFPTGTLVLNGGGIQYPVGVTTDLTSGGHTLVLGTGGGTIDTNGNNVNFAGTIVNSSTGSLTKTGAGTLSVSSPLTLTNLYVRGGSSAAPSTFALNGITNTLTATGTVGIGEASGDNAFITLDNGAKLTASTLSVADAVATGTALPYNDGTLNIADTGNLGTAVTTSTFYLGYANGGTNGLGVVNQSAGTFKATGTSYIGYNGTGLYNMAAGTTNFSSQYVGYGTTGVGAINQSAGTVNNSGGLYVGYNGVGTINLTGGLWNETSTTYLGYLSHTNLLNIAGGHFNTSSTFYEDLDGGVGIVNLSSGSFTTTGGSSLYMSDFEPGNNQVNVTGGSFNVSGTMYVGYYSNSGSVNTLNISGGTAVVGGTLYLGYGDSYSAGSLFLTGTTLRVGAITSSTSTVGTAAFNGATVVANSSSTTFISSLSSATIGTGGLTINTNGFNDTVPQNLSTGVTGSADGGLTKTGVGTLTLSGFNTYTGATNINLGGVIASGTQPFGAPGNVVNINTGGMIGVSNDSQIALYTNGTTTLPYTFNYNGGGYEFLNYNSSLNIVTPPNITLGAATGNPSTFMGNVSGTGLVTYAGPGTLILLPGTINNTGGENIVGGIVAISSDAVFNGVAPTFTGTSGYLQLNYSTGFTFSSGPVNLAVPTATTVTLNSALTGTAALTYIGPGTLILSQPSTTSGATNIAGGTLNFNGSLGTGNILLTGGGILQFAAGQASPPDLTAGQTFTLGGNGVIDTNGNNVTFTGSIAGANLGTFTKNGSGGLTVQGSLTPVSATIQTGTAANPSMLAFNGPTAVFSSNSTGNGFSVGEQTGDYAVLNVSNGASLTVAGGGFNIADQASAVTNNPGVASDTGIINLSGAGSIITSGGTVAIGKGNASNNKSYGTVNQTGGTFQMSNTTSAVTLGVNNQSTGIYNITGGLAAFNSVALTANAGAVAVVNLSGGTFQVNNISAGTGQSTLNFNGGTLKANSSSATFVAGVTNVKVLAGGGTINTNGFSDTITSAITTGITGGADGGLIKTGAGTLTLTGVNNYSGGTTVNGGSLLASTTGALSTGRITVNTGGAVNVTNTNAISPGQPITLGGGTLSLASPSTSVIASGFSTFTQINTNTSSTTAFVPSNNGSNITLTQSGTGAWAASTWTPITISDAATYTMTFNYNHSIGAGVNQVADGISFGFQNDPRGLSAIGAQGGSEAYSSGTGPSPITKSEVGYYDLYNEAYGLGANGVLTSFGGSTPISANGNEAITLVYNGPAKTFTSTMNYGTGTYTATATGIDLASILGGTAGGTATGYFGFGGATGGVTANQSVQSLVLTASVPGGVTISSPISLSAGTASNLQLGSVTGAANSTVGTLTFGAGSTLFVTNTGTAASYSLTTGAVSLSGVDTLDVSSNGSSGSAYLGGLNDGGVASTLVIQDAGVVTLTAPATSLITGSAINVSTGSSLVVSGLGALGSGSLNVAGKATFSANASGGNFIQTMGSLNVLSGGLVSFAKSNPISTRTLLITTGVTVAPTGSIDLSNNALDVQAGSLSSITSLVAQGYSGGTWQGSGGIISSAAASDPAQLTTLGVILNSPDGGVTQLYGAGTALGLFEGANPAATDVLVKDTYYGDTNLDGTVDGSDYNRIDNGFLNGMTGWYNGDFNYDGVIDGSDYTLIDNAYNTQGAALSSQIAAATAEVAGTGSSVPEPTSLALLGIGAASLLGRRRRRM